MRLAVGESVGLSVGLAVGESVGLSVGLAVGESVGLSVGLAVGESVASETNKITNAKSTLNPIFSASFYAELNSSPNLLLQAETLSRRNPLQLRPAAAGNERGVGTYELGLILREIFFLKISTTRNGCENHRRGGACQRVRLEDQAD